MARLVPACLFSKEASVGVAVTDVASKARSTLDNANKRMVTDIEPIVNLKPNRISRIQQQYENAAPLPSTLCLLLIYLRFMDNSFLPVLLPSETPQRGVPVISK
jgi:hypothetical protein